MNESKPTSSYSILIADDDVGVRETLRDIVEGEGYQTRLARCGEEALEIVRLERVHLALLDMHMPNLTGLETLQLARQFDHLLPAILITANANRDIIRRAFELHVFSVLPKPVTRGVVVQTVVRALKRFYDSVNLPTQQP